MAEINHVQLLHDRANATLKAHGVVSIVFGILGTLIGLGFAFIVIVMGAMASYDTSEIAGAIIYAFAVLAFGVLPHIFFIISGAHLVRNPTPGTAKGLVITNLIISALWNLPILILAIINLTQLPDYAHGYKKS